MSQMLPEGGEVMRRVACGDVCPAPAPAPAPHPSLHTTHNRSSENKELLRQQLLSASKERLAEKAEPPKQKHARNRQKNRWKLKFHHQALPQEYLDHYEQSLQKANAKQKQKPDKPKTETIDVNNITNETFKIWAQRLAGIQNETGTLTVPQVPAVLNMATKPNSKTDDKKKNPAIAPSKIVTYEDLPYMGEMTLNNSKPRRGRKPKKADICHLIYENYGTVVPGQPPPADRLNQLNMPPFRNTDHPVSTPKTDLQNKIISSLLERKLSQENKKRLETLSPPRFTSPDEPMPEAPLTIAGPLHSDDEPLNLCIRDLHDLKIQIQKKFGNIYTSAPDVKTEPESETVEQSLKTEQPNAISVIQRNTNLLPATASSSPDLSRQHRNLSPTLSEPAQSTSSPDGEGKFPGYVYWPNAGVYMHPLALQTQLMYYQRLAAAGQLPFSAEDQDRVVTPSSESVSESNPSPLDDGKNKLVLKQISELLDPKVIKQVEEARTTDHSKMKRASPNPVQGPVKRKRSAIFIPPRPTKSSSTTPTTEVSICKFKFTGGSKPSLQEKKMLSVDSGGNFRYYSGTGNKGNKGYEYLQRDANQNRMEPSEPSVSTLPRPESQSSCKEDLSKKKRKSRKSLQREKLEQTFKEKGFLIQTQQLQSAEGATYCKFRQLRKFTRYLFRSWKDYLPGELDERTAEESQRPVEAPPSNEGAAGEWG